MTDLRSVRGESLGRREVVTGLGGALAVGAGSRAMGASPAPREAPWTDGGVIQRSGGQISFVTLGSGAPIVLLHKLGGSVADWRKAAPLLAARGRRVIALDLPGHGRSTLLGAPPHVQSVAETTAMLAAALDEIGVGRCVVVGNSLGGVCGVLMSAFWPERVSKLVLISVSMIPAMTRAQVDVLDSNVRSAFGPNWEPLPRPAADAAAIGFKDPAVLREDNESRARTGVWLRPAERGVGLVGVTDYLPRIRAPTLVLLADSGRYVKYGAVAKAMIPDVRVVQIADSGSFIQQEKPLEAAGAINAFLET